jgi:hypothetical protein
MITAKCKSGLHEWINETDAQKCCSGYRRVMILYPMPGEVDSFYGWYGYKWVKEDQVTGKDEVGQSGCLSV